MARMNLTVITTHDAYKIEQLIDTCGVYCREEANGVRVISDDLSKEDYYKAVNKLDDSTYVYNLHADDFFLNSIMNEQKIMYKMQCNVDEVKPSINGFYEYMKKAVGEVLMPNIHEINEYFATNYGGYYAQV